MGRPRIVREPLSAPSPFGNTRQTFRHNERGNQRPSFPERAIRAPSPGAAGEASAEDKTCLGRGEGGRSTAMMNRCVIP